MSSSVGNVDTKPIHHRVQQKELIINKRARAYYSSRYGSGSLSGTWSHGQKQPKDYEYIQKHLRHL